MIEPSLFDEPEESNVVPLVMRPACGVCGVPTNTVVAKGARPYAPCCASPECLAAL
jgi:hypothetical protein